jgi:hypothetical protein
MTTTRLSHLQQEFLGRTNPPRTRQRALAAGIAAASQHNVLYRAGVEASAKREVRDGWLARLDELALRYARPRSATDYEHDVEWLWRDMNSQFAAAFYRQRHPRYGYDPGFRISHAQKSLSIVLKHLWCLGEVAMPPQCPVDSVVLRRVGLRYPNTRWAYVNSIEDHRSKIQSLEEKAHEAELPLAEWELGEW